MRFLRLLSMTALFTLSSSAAFAGDYTLSDGQGLLYIQVFKDPDTLGAGLSHDHIMRATGWTGKASYDAANPGACSISITVPAAQLAVDEDNMRQRVGYDTTLSSSQREEVKGHMLATSQLNANAHPNLTFQSTSCTANSISGNLTIRGKSQTVTVPMQISEDGSSFSASGSVKIRATEFGFQPYSALFGQLKNLDEMKMTINLKG